MYHHPNLTDLPDDDGTRRFETSAAQVTEYLVVGAVMVAAGAVGFWYWGQGRLQGEAAALPFLFVPGGVVLIGLQLWNLVRPVRVDLTADGFEVGGEACRWDEVAAVGEQRHPESEVGGLVVRVRRADGWVFKLSSARLAGLPGLLGAIHRHTLSRLTAEARAAIRRGEAVEFGPVEADATGLRARGRLLHWEELERVVPDEEGDVGFWAAGRRWLDEATGRVDNLRVLLQLAGEYAPDTRAGTSPGQKWGQQDVSLRDVGPC